MIPITADTDVIDSPYIDGMFDVLVVEVHCVFDLPGHERPHLGDAEETPLSPVIKKQGYPDNNGDFAL